MKKIKLLTGLAGIAGLTAAVVPAMTACSKKGQSGETTEDKFITKYTEIYNLKTASTKKYKTEDVGAKLSGTHKFTSRDGQTTTTNLTAINYSTETETLNDCMGVFDTTGSTTISISKQYTPTAIKTYTVVARNSGGFAKYYVTDTTVAYEMLMYVDQEKTQSVYMYFCSNNQGYLTKYIDKDTDSFGVKAKETTMTYTADPE